MHNSLNAKFIFQYYDKEVFPSEKEQNAFEKNLFQKTHKANGLDFTLLDFLIF